MADEELRNKINKIKENKESFRRKPRTFRRVKNLAISASIILTLTCGGIYVANKLDFRHEDQASYVPQKKFEKYRKYENRITGCVALVEGFSNGVYDDGTGQETIAYGNTVVNGKKVTDKTLPVDRTLSKEFLEKINPSKPYMENVKEGMYLRGKEYVIEHMEREIYPVLDSCLTTNLTENEMLGTIMFAYNVGAEAFKSSEFLKALNKGERGVEAAKKMTGFRSINGGQFSTGLLKRHWVEIAIFVNPNVISVDTNGKKVVKDFMSYIPTLKPEQFYREKDMSSYYKEKMKSVASNDYYTPKLDNETLLKFIKNNSSTRNNVGNILDSKTRDGFNQKLATDTVINFYGNKKNCR